MITAPKTYLLGEGIDPIWTMIPAEKSRKAAFPSYEGLGSQTPSGF